MRRPMAIEYKKLSRADKSTKLVPATNPVMQELKSVSDLIYEFSHERNNLGTWSLSYRDGVRAITEMAFKRMFVDLKGT
jgi:hypothetical protein